jgi:hypothetical protein
MRMSHMFSLKVDMTRAEVSLEKGRLSSYSAAYSGLLPGPARAGIHRWRDGARKRTHPHNVKSEG